MTHLLPAGWASRQHGSPGALREGGWALPAAVPMQTGWEVTGGSPGMHSSLCTPGRVGNRGRPGPSVLAASAPTLRVGVQGWLRVRELCRQGTGRVRAGYRQAEMGPGHGQVGQVTEPAQHPHLQRHPPCSSQHPGSRRRAHDNKCL